MTEFESQMIAELKKLNANMERLLCFQQFTKKYADYRAAMGQSSGSLVEGKGSVPHPPVPDYGANGLPPNA